MATATAPAPATITATDVLPYKDGASVTVDLPEVDGMAGKLFLTRHLVGGEQHRAETLIMGGGYGCLRPSQAAIDAAWAAASVVPGGEQDIVVGSVGPGCGRPEYGGGITSAPRTWTGTVQVKMHGEGGCLTPVTITREIRGSCRTGSSWGPVVRIDTRGIDRDRLFKEAKIEFNARVVAILAAMGWHGVTVTPR